MNPHVDLNPSVMSGLGWYYLLAAVLNAAAAAHCAYGDMVSEGASIEGLAPKTRRMPPWLPKLFFGVYGLAVLMIVLREFLPGAVGAAYGLCALANAVVALAAVADGSHHADPFAAGPTRVPSLDDHQPAVGLGGPIDRALWTTICGVLAIVFQILGMVYALGHEVYMPQLFRDAIDSVAGPTTFFIGATIAFVLMIRFRRFIVKGTVAWAAVNLFLIYFGMSMTDYDFRDIVTKPDNVPIVGLLILVAGFFWYGMRRAVINDERIAAGLPNLEELEPEKTLCWPDLVYTELMAMVGATVLLVVWGIVLRAPLEQPASSTVAPNPSKAPWYFLGLQEMLVYFDPWMAGVVLPSLIIVGLIAIPYIDTNKAGNGYYTYNERKFAFNTFQFGFVVLWVVLILLGTFLRGPNWNFFGPYEYWDLHKLIPLNNVNLSELVWIQLLGKQKPDSIFLREIVGIALCLGYFTVVPYLLYRFFFRDYVKQAGLVRYATLAMLILFMASLPIKMVLRWTLNLKYVVAIPEYFFNI